MTAPAANRNPVLRTPYEAPVSHWRLDHRGRTLDAEDPGRRPSLSRIEIPEPAPGKRSRPWPLVAETDRTPRWFDEQTDPAARVEPHRTINELRDLLARWRDQRWPGASRTTRKLLEHWSSPPEGIPMRPFWCQLEAAETVIWLLEGGPASDPEACRAIHDRLRQTNETWNEGIPRLALKAATGTGKTHLMAMLALWWASRRDEPVHLLAIAPNLTVKAGLEKSLDPTRGHPTWDAITPRGLERVRRRLRVTVLNFQKFQTRKGLDGFEDAGGKEKKFVTAGDRRREWEETSDAMLRRLLDRGHTPTARFLVINDEAHHCRAPQREPLRGLEADERREQQSAALWFSAIAALHRAGRLERVLDFSATPMWLRKPVRLESEIFPWTVSDFPLLDAIESGLVKVPRVPVDDDAESHEPRYRNIYLFAGKKKIRESEPQGEVREPLEQLYEHYEKRISPTYEAKRVLPILIVVANTVQNADTLHRWIAGSPRAEGRGTPGNLPLLSNYEADGAPRAKPPTVLVHSRLFESGEGEAVGGNLGKAIEEQASLHAPDAKTRAEKQKAIRDIFMTTGRDGEPGEHIRCVISVGMLTEGWDARNVTHIFGYRRFGSLLLCEQVTGRALRRTSFSGRDEKQTPEYANVFGVPYNFAPSEDEDDPVPEPPIQPWRVYTVPGRSFHRIAFPQVVGFAPPERIRRWRLDPARVEPHAVPPRPTPGWTDEAGPAGREVDVARLDRQETDLWRAAAQVAVHLDPSRTQRRPTFSDSLIAVREWLTLPGIVCPDPSALQFDERAIPAIARACEPTEDPGALRPVFADERDRAAPRIRDTSGVDFETVLRHRWDATNSELNAAACHSAAERELAAILDSHPRIEAWARNFRLGWEVPWFDPEHDQWRRTEPDFVARAAPRGGEPPIHLVIEFKGMKAGEASEEAKRLWLDRWCDAVSVHGEFGRWRVVWIESLLHAAAQIEAAISGREDA